MSQVSTGANYEVDNSTGANVRADINEIFDAILTMNSGSSSPSYAKAYTLWADTNAGTMKIRNGANNAWIELFQLDGTLTLEDGSASTPGLAFRDDLDTGIFSGGANEFNISTGGTERFVINSSGNVGIGTTSPSGASGKVLEINGGSGQARFVLKNNTTGSTSTDGHQIFSDGTTLGIQNREAGNTTFETNGSERMRIDSSGNVGIGTSSPSMKLDVENTSACIIQAKSTDNNTSTVLQLIGKNSSGTSRTAKMAYDNADEFRLITSDAIPITFATSGAERMRIDTSGNVGIGTATPSSFNADGRNLVVGTGSGGQGLSIYSANNNYGNIYFADGTSDGSYNAGGILYNHTSNFMRFDTAAGERMRIDSSGNLVVGATTAQASDSATLMADGEVTAAGFYFTNNVGSPMNSDGIRRATTNTMVFDTNSTERVRIDSAGHFLFSCTVSDDTTDTGIKLFENSNIPYITNTINSSSANHSFYHLYNKNASNNGYRFYVKQDGGIANHSSNNSNLSDEREKKNITLMGSVYDTFKQFVFKDFNYISEDDSVTKKHGLIAQDVESIDSDLIADDFKTSVDSEGNDILRKALKEEQFMMIGFKALQEAIAKIEVLETEVAALKAA